MNPNIDDALFTYFCIGLGFYLAVTHRAQAGASSTEQEENETPIPIPTPAADAGSYYDPSVADSPGPATPVSPTPTLFEVEEEYESEEELYIPDYIREQELERETGWVADSDEEDAFAQAYYRIKGPGPTGLEAAL